MNLEDSVISFVGMDSTEALKKYALEKLGKYEYIIEKATHIDVFLKQNVSHRGAKSDFTIDINVSVPNAVIRVEERGEEMYALIDSATDVLNKRFRRYTDKQTQWEGATPWKEIEILSDEMEVDMDEDEPDNYLSYEPTISHRETFSESSPMEEAEAIEQMELMGRNQILFRNKKSNGLAMLYKRSRGGYAIVEIK